MNWKDIGVRALKTLVQTFLSVATVQMVIAQDVNALRAAAVGALAAGIAVIWNAVLQWSQS